MPGVWRVRIRIVGSEGRKSWEQIDSTDNMRARGWTYWTIWTFWTCRSYFFHLFNVLEVSRPGGLGVMGGLGVLVFLFFSAILAVRMWCIRYLGG